MSSRWTGFFIWALVAASSAFWGFKIFAATRPVPLGAQAPTATIPPAGSMERLFGVVVVPTTPAEVQHPESERFQLVGVIAPPDNGAGGGYALVTIDGAPAKSWRVGATLDGNTTLLRVSKRGADFGPAGGPAAFALQLPEPAAAETGSLPVAVSQPENTAQPMPSTSRGNADHVAQPGVPGMQRGAIGGFQRGAFPATPGRMAPVNQPAPGLAPPAEEQQKPDAQ